MGINIIAATIIWIILLLVVIGIPVAVFIAIKHLIKFTARTIYEEKARAEERHRQNTYDRKDC